MDGIYQFPHDGTHLDLSKIVSIGPCFVRDNNGWGVTAGFTVQFQLRDKTTTYQWRAEVPANVDEETTWGDMPYLESGGLHAIDLWRPILTPRINEVREGLIAAWKEYRTWANAYSLVAGSSET